MLPCPIRDNSHCSSQHQDVMQSCYAEWPCVLWLHWVVLTPWAFLCVCRPIMSLSNCLMYDGRLECGSERTASARLALPFLVSVQSELSSHCEATPKDLEWVQAALLPGNPVCFLDTTQVLAVIYFR